MKLKAFSRRFWLGSLTLALLAASFISIGSAGPSNGTAGDERIFESCTSIFVGRLASADGSTMTSHSCDSGTDRTWITIVPRAAHKSGDMEKVYADPKRTKGPDDTDRIETGAVIRSSWQPVQETFSPGCT